MDPVTIYQSIIHSVRYHPRRHILALGLLWLLALGLLGVGAAEHTGVTGKDEYYLGLRVPLCMQEQQVWLVPCLDGEPRLRKPPMLYWLTWASFELFGPSLGSARLVAVILASLSVIAVAMIALELGDGLKTALTAGIILLSCLGFAVGGRMLELDVPVATWSTLAYLWLLRWYRQNQFWAAILAAICLTAGFLTKGPVVLVVCGAGGMALLATDSKAWIFFRQHWLGMLGVMFLAASLILPWFIYAYVQYPAASAAALDGELRARNFFTISLVPLYGTLLLAMPWGFVLLQRIFTSIFNSGTTTAQAANPNLVRMRVLWLGLTLLPFFFFRSFERYLVGSLVPIALLLALSAENFGTFGWRWAARLGFVLTFTAALLVQIGAVAVSGLAPWLVLSLLASGWFCLQWWRANNSNYMALSAAILWSCIIGLAYPHLGINQIPADLIDLVRNHEIVLYDGPQPALLPAVLGRSLVHTDGRWHLPKRLKQPGSQFFMLSEAQQTASAVAGLQRLGFQTTERGRFGVLSARVTWSNMLRPGTTYADVWAAVRHGNIDSIKPQVWLHWVHNSKYSTSIIQ